MHTLHLNTRSKKKAVLTIYYIFNNIFLAITAEGEEGEHVEEGEGNVLETLVLLQKVHVEKAHQKDQDCEKT